MITDKADEGIFFKGLQIQTPVEVLFIWFDQPFLCNCLTIIVHELSNRRIRRYEIVGDVFKFSSTIVLIKGESPSIYLVIDKTTKIHNKYFFSWRLLFKVNISRSIQFKCLWAFDFFAFLIFVHSLIFICFKNNTHKKSNFLLKKVTNAIRFLFFFTLRRWNMKHDILSFRIIFFFQTTRNGLEINFLFFFFLRFFKVFLSLKSEV